MEPAALRAAVAAREPVDAREAASVSRFLRELDRLRRPFDEHADPVHVTASAIVTGPRGTVLHLHKRLGLWLQPGGHIDPRDHGWEEPWEAALREAAEETGLAVAHPAAGPRLVHVDVHPGPKGHTHLDVRYLLEADGDPAPGEGESRDVRWFAWDDALAVADPGLSGALAALRP
ncbi:MAG TPA: NUDIX domain-containing protein [Egibacteraceae bacterium]|nr:NUDIX domain-containing protein [Egibacteraceae bacterium]